MKRMAMDSSTDTLAITFLEDDRVLWDTRLSGKRQHAEAVIGLIETGLKQTGLKVRDFDSFLVGIGPGSYTGLRVALSVAKMFAWSLDKPLFTASSLDIVASAALRTTGDYIITENAKTGAVYGKVLSSDGGHYTTLMKETYATCAEWDALTSRLKGTALTEATFAIDFTFPLHETRVEDLHDLTPNYLREQVIG